MYELPVPPLRRRGAADLRKLIDTILRRFGGRKRRQVPPLEVEVFDLFVRYTWPGNIRELENTLERMMVAAGEEAVLRREHLPEDFGTAGSKSSLQAGHSAMVLERTATLPSAAEVQAALERNGFKRGPEAAELGLSRHQLYRLLKRRETGASIVHR